MQSADLLVSGFFLQMLQNCYGNRHYKFERKRRFFMKQLISIIMTMLIICAICIPVSAQTNPEEMSTENLVMISDLTEGESVPETTTSAPGPTVGAEETTQPTAPPATEPVPEIPTEAPQETTFPEAAPENCNHSWVYVEVNPTCTEYGGRGYVCVYCEALTDLEAINMIPHTYDHSCDPDCNVCGSVRTVTHKYSTEWSKNSTQHWHACSVCGEKSETGSHYPGPAATEEKAQYCLTCGLMMMPKKDHTHQYATIYTTDGLEHWFSCKGCEERKDRAPHSYDTPCDPDCNVCGYTSVTEHDYGVWNADDEGHWKICDLCGYSTEPEQHLPQTVQQESETLRCSICDFVVSEASEHKHNATGNWNCDNNNHWKLCECGEKTEEAPHSWEKGVETDDTVQYICVCGAKMQEAVIQEKDGVSWWIPVSILALLTAAAGLAVSIVVKFKSRK